MMNSFAPVLIPTLNRFEHFKRCVESLAKCTHSEKTDLIIAFDYPLNDSHWEGYRKIEAYLDKITGFKAIQIIKRKENYGAIKNYIDGKQIVFEKYDRIIFSEDDNEFSPNFLDYINKGLDKFEDDPLISAICGYNYPINISPKYLHNYYYSKAFSAWGYGTWRNRLTKLTYTKEELIILMRNFKFVKSLYTLAPHKPLAILTTINNNKQIYGDGAISNYNLINDSFCVFPVFTKVKNYGHDGSGVHCPNIVNNKFDRQIVDPDNTFTFSPNVPYINKYIKKSLKSFFSISFKAKLKTIYLYIVFLIK